MSDWNTKQYMKFLGERTRPVEDLLSRVEISPKRVLDIGCGPANSTFKLWERFKNSEILGVDSSENMLQKARESYGEIIQFKKCYVPDELSDLGEFDLIFSNACLHWIPNHEELLPRIFQHVSVGGSFAVQMPKVQDAVFYKVLWDLVKEKRWESLSEIDNFHNLSSEATFEILSRISEDVTMWETVYYHVVDGISGVVEWYKGSGLRPYLEALGEVEREDFVGELSQRLSEKITVLENGKAILKMPRLFFVARK